MNHAACSTLLSLLAAALVTTPSAAQIVTHTLPKIAHHAFGNRHGTAAGPTFRTQSWYAGANLPIGFTIHQIGLRASSTLASPAYTADAQLTLENTGLPHNGLSQVYANNLGPGATVLFNGPVTAAARPPATSPSDATIWYTLTAPFVFQGPNLIVDLQLTNLVTNSPLTVDFVSMCPNLQAAALTSPNGCGARIDATYLGGIVQLTSATPVSAHTPVAMLLGFETVRNATVAFPFDLGGYGMNGCSLGVDPIAVAPLTADAQGAFGHSFPAPLPASWYTVSAQALHLSAATTLGAATSNTVHVILGNQGQCRSLAGASLVYAPPPATCDAAPVMLLN